MQTASGQSQSVVFIYRKVDHRKGPGTFESSWTFSHLQKEQRIGRKTKDAYFSCRLTFSKMLMADAICEKESLPKQLVRFTSREEQNCQRHGSVCNFPELRVFVAFRRNRATQSYIEKYSTMQTPEAIRKATIR